MPQNLEFWSPEKDATRENLPLISTDSAVTPEMLFVGYMFPNLKDTYHSLLTIYTFVLRDSPEDTELKNGQLLLR